MTRSSVRLAWRPGSPPGRCRRRARRPSRVRLCVRGFRRAGSPGCPARPPRPRPRPAGRARAGTGPASTGFRAGGSCRDRRTAGRSGRGRTGAFRRPGREAADGRGGAGDDEADNRRRVGRSSRDPHRGEGEDGRAGRSRDSERSSRGQAIDGLQHRDDHGRAAIDRDGLVPAFVGGGRCRKHPDLVAVGVKTLEFAGARPASSASKPIWIVMLHSDLDPGDFLALAVAQVGGHAGMDRDRRSGGSPRGGWPGRAAA